MEALSAFSLPPGFGFHPTDVELVSHYLKRKILGLKIDYEVIPEVEIYKHEPWDLPARCQIPTSDCKWHFFASRDKKYPNGTRTNRATEAGYWKSTGKDRNIRSHNRVIGTKKTLVFHEGRPPYGKRTEWIMHEFYINAKECKAAPDMKDAYVLCRVTNRNGLAMEGENVSPPTNSLSQPKDMACQEEYSSPSDNVADIEAMLMELTDPRDIPTPTEDKDAYVLCRVTKRNGLAMEGESVSPPTSSLNQPKDISCQEEYSSPSDNVDNIEAMLMELTDPRDIPTPTEDKAVFHSPDLKQEIVDPYPEVSEAPCILSPVVDLFSILESDPQKFDIFGELDIGSIDSLSDIFPFIGNQHDVFYNNYLGTAYNNDTDDAEIQLRERTVKPSTAVTRHSIKLQVSKMEARNGKALSKTVEIINQGGHLDLYNEKQFVTDSKILSDASRAKMIAKKSNSRQRSAGSLRNFGGISCIQGITGKLPNFLGCCPSASTSCLILSGCMMGTAALISYFMLRDSRGFFGSLSVPDLH